MIEVATRFYLLVPFVVCDRFKEIEILYNKNTILVVGDAKAAQNNPITKQYSQFFLALIIDTITDKIIDCECSSTLRLTNQFVYSLLINRKMNESEIEETINNRYLGASQKALIVAFHDAKKKYEQAKAALTTRSQSKPSPIFIVGLGFICLPGNS